MDPERAEAIVLRTQPVTESSLIVTWFTRDFGRLKTIAKGARRPKSPMRGKIDLFYHDEIVFLRSIRSDLHLLKDCFLEKPRKKLRESMGRLAAASYACELVELATELEDANPKIFDLLESVLDTMETRPNAVLSIWFELQLLAVAGWKPKWERRTGVPKVLTSLAETTLVGARRVRLTETQIREARDALWRFWDFELGRAPRSRKLLVGFESDSALRPGTNPVR
jgi:DNA repair protein RecO (recombination protein O)